MPAELIASQSPATNIVESKDIDARRALLVMLWLMPEVKRNRILPKPVWFDFLADMYQNDHDYAQHFFVEPDIIDGVANLKEPPAPWRQVLEISEMIHLS